jgi:hypothetical protein
VQELIAATIAKFKGKRCRTTYDDFSLQTRAGHEQEGAHLNLQLPVLRQGVFPVHPGHSQAAGHRHNLSKLR